MGHHYYYRGKRYTRKPGLKSKLKRFAGRVWENMQGGHPGGAEAYVERMIREFPGKRDEKETGETPAPEKEEDRDVKLMW